MRTRHSILLLLLLVPGIAFSQSSSQAKSQGEILLAIQVLPDTFAIHSEIVLPDSLGLNGTGTDVVPNPFLLVSRVYSISNVTGTIASVRASMLPDFGLQFDAATPAEQFPNRVLKSGDTLLSTWIVHVVPSRFRRSVRFAVTVTDHNGNLTERLRLLSIVALPPANMPPDLRPSCSVPDSLHFDAALDRYLPDPLIRRIGCINKGGTPAYNVTAFTYLPSGVVLRDTSETLRKAFASPMQPRKDGDSVQWLSWSLTYTKRLRDDSFLDFKTVIGGVDSAGTPLDSVEVWCRTRVPGLVPAYSCSMTLPDSLPLNAAQTDVTPNPFTIQYTVRNTSLQSGSIALVDLQFPVGDGLALDSSTPKTRNLNQALEPGDSIVVSWMIHVQNRETRRNATLLAIAYDDEGNPRMCSEELPIAAVTLTSLQQLADVPSVRLSGGAPNPFSSTTTISYEIPVATHVRLAVFDALGREVAVLENGLMTPGKHSVVFDAGTLPPGLYFSRMESAAGTRSIRMLLQR